MGEAEGWREEEVASAEGPSLDIRDILRALASAPLPVLAALVCPLVAPC
jgi:hypothetical protein